jgi:Ca2+-binding RTX toxin-like protein
VSGRRADCPAQGVTAIHITTGDEDDGVRTDVALPTTIDVGPGDDRVTGGPGNDTIIGGAGNDQLKGGGGDDTLDGGAGDDRLDGKAGVDVLAAGDGNDRVKSRDRLGEDVACGPGTDRVTADVEDTLHDCE